MTKMDDEGALWTFNEVWGIPPEVPGAVTDQENLDYGKALLIAANGDGRLTEAETRWVVGYLTAAGNSAANLATLKACQGDDDFESLFTSGVQTIAQRVCIGDAIRACGADGEIADEELAIVRGMADRLGVPAEVVDQLVEIYRQEQELKARRVKLVFPSGFGTS